MKKRGRSLGGVSAVGTQPSSRATNEQPKVSTVSSTRNGRGSGLTPRSGGSKPSVPVKLLKYTPPATVHANGPFVATVVLTDLHIDAGATHTVEWNELASGAFLTPASQTFDFVAETTDAAAKLTVIMKASVDAGASIGQQFQTSVQIKKNGVATMAPKVLPTTIA